MTAYFYRTKLIKVEALESSSGLMVGDRIVFGGYKRLDRNIEPIKSGTITDIQYLCDFGLSYYRLKVKCDPNPESIIEIEAAESYFRVPAPITQPAGA